MTNLTKANTQWQTRPADERFWDLTELGNSVLERRMRAGGSNISRRHLRVEEIDGGLFVRGPSTGALANLTHYSFGQLSAQAGAPAGYLRSLPAPLAAQCINTGLAGADEDTESRLLFDRKPTGVELRAVTSEGYERVWDNELVDAVASLGGGWRTAPARPTGQVGERTRRATAADVLRYCSHASLGVKEGDEIAPAGLYASDRDVFIFMVDDSKRIEVNGASLCRGFFAWNSEVGDKSLGMQTFLFDAVCGNHIVWGARDVKEIRLRHTKSLSEGRWERQLSATAIEYANGSAREDEMRILRSQTTLVGESKEAVIKKLFGLKDLALPRKTIEAAYDIANTTPRYGDARSAWAMVNGLTEVSQRATHTDERVKLDRAAGRLLEMAF